MEDYQAAFLARIMDVEALLNSGRRTAAMHFGGVAIECLLKYIICTSLPKNSKEAIHLTMKRDSNATHLANTSKRLP